MKFRILFVTLAAYVAMSCESVNTIDIDTNLKKTIIADVEKPLEGALLKSTASYGFSESDTLDLKDNEDLYDYISRINELDITSATCKLSGIPAGEEVSELSVIAEKAGVKVTLSGLTENNNEIELGLSKESLNAFGQYLLDNESIEIKIEGSSSYAPMKLSVGLDFKTIVKAKIIN
jgi:hypothetical protein